MIRFNILLPLLCLTFIANAQEILPPVPAWQGKSLELIVAKNNPWITPTEQSDFVNTPSYEETMTWLTKLCTAADVLEMTTVGTSANGRIIPMVIASQDGSFGKTALRASSKPL